MNAGSSRLVVASNRLPVEMTRDEDGSWKAEPGSGGLVTALTPLLQESGGVWIGSTGPTEGEPVPEVVEALEDAAGRTGYSFSPVWLTNDDWDDYYRGASNEVLWPLLHGLQERYYFKPSYWEAYKRVNQKFAETVAAEATPDDFVWAHDYHLMLLARELRRLGVSTPTGYFLHTPFPPPDLYEKLPWRYGLLKSLLDYDLLGFQTLRDRDHFLDCVEMFFPDPTVERDGPLAAVRSHDRSVQVGAFPISIDVGEFEEVARSDETERWRREIHRHHSSEEMLLSVSRLDYTKGIPEELRAFRCALERYDDLRGRVSLTVVAVPSREGIPEYEKLKTDIEQLIGKINGRFGQNGWVPVHFMYRSLSRARLVAYYRSASALLVASLKDGMNLVAKEYCVVNRDAPRALILSEFTGAAAQLRGESILINPHDIIQTADAIHTALTMDPQEQRRRMRRLAEKVEEQDLSWWVDSFFGAVTEGTRTVAPQKQRRTPQKVTRPARPTRVQD